MMMGTEEGNGLKKCQKRSLALKDLGGLKCEKKTNGDCRDKEISGVMKKICTRTYRLGGW